MENIPRTNNPPYLSIVFCGRNDNYGGDFTARLKRSLYHYVKQINRVKLESELIFVNYNPIEENPAITKILDWPSSKFLKIRIITVSPEIHKSLIDETVRKTYPLFEFLAKNIGIRRASGKFILGTNADILFSEKLFDFLGEKSLQSKTIYRCDRLDFKADDITDVVDEEDIRNRIFEAYLQGGTFKKKIPLSTNNWLKLCRYYNGLRKVVHGTTRPWKIIKYIPLFNHVGESEAILFKYPFNASGDFMLMDRSSWFETRAYPEDTWLSTHTDSLYLMQAIRSRNKVVRLDFPVYHQDHQRRFVFDGKNPDMEKMYARLLKDLKGMQEKETFLVNDEKWGLAEEILEEITLC